MKLENREPPPDLSEEVIGALAMALGEALAAQFKADIARNHEEKGNSDIRKLTPRAGFGQKEERGEPMNLEQEAADVAR